MSSGVKIYGGQRSHLNLKAITGQTEIPFPNYSVYNYTQTVKVLCFSFFNFCNSWGKEWRQTSWMKHASVSGSSLCCEGCEVEELLPREPSWEQRAAGRRACVHWRAAGTRPAACVWLSWRCCANRPAQSEDGPRTSGPASPAWCSASSVCGGPGGGKQLVCICIATSARTTAYR